MSSPLRDGLKNLDTISRLTLATLALASGLYTYLGVRQLLDGSAGIVFFAAVVYSAAVSVGIYCFWSFLMRFVPHVRDAGRRMVLVGAMALGSAMIIAMSSWLNAAALAGSAALEQHLAVAVEGYTRDLDRAHSNALAAQSLLPDIEMASLRFSRLAEAEREAGSLTGTAGSGTVVQLLTQMSAQLDGLADEVRESADRVKSLYAEGGAHLARMRELVSARGPINPRGDAFAGEAVALVGVIAALEQTSIAPSVRRAADDLAMGFIAPVADGSTADLAARQSAVVGNVESAVEAQSQALSAAASEIMAVPPVEVSRFKPLSTAEAVLVYAGDFLPSWAGAISIDLLPAVLILILTVVHSVLHREAGHVADAHSMTAADLMKAARLIRDVEAHGVPLAASVEAVRQQPATGTQPDEEAAEAEATVAQSSPDDDRDAGANAADDKVTALDPGRRGRME